LERKEIKDSDWSIFLCFRLHPIRHFRLIRLERRFRRYVKYARGTLSSALAQNTVAAPLPPPSSLPLPSSSSPPPPPLSHTRRMSMTVNAEIGSHVSPFCSRAHCWRTSADNLAVPRVSERGTCQEVSTKGKYAGNMVFAMRAERDVGRHRDVAFPCTFVRSRARAKRRDGRRARFRENRSRLPRLTDPVGIRSWARTCVPGARGGEGVGDVTASAPPSARRPPPTALPPPPRRGPVLPSRESLITRDQRGPSASARQQVSLFFFSFPLFRFLFRFPSPPPPVSNRTSEGHERNNASGC